MEPWCTQMEGSQKLQQADLARNCPIPVLRSFNPGQRIKKEESASRHSWREIPVPSSSPSTSGHKARLPGETCAPSPHTSSELISTTFLHRNSENQHLKIFPIPKVIQWLQSALPKVAPVLEPAAPPPQHNSPPFQDGWGAVSAGVKKEQARSLPETSLLDFLRDAGACSPGNWVGTQKLEGLKRFSLFV